MDILKHKIMWIASYPKSGNTWVRMLLTTYMNNGVCDIQECLPFSDTIPEYYAGFLQDMSNLSLMEQVLLRPAAFLRMLEANKQDLLVKTHSANISLGGVQLIPEGVTKGAIVIVRDPRDVALSFQNHLGDENLSDTVTKMLTPDGAGHFDGSKFIQLYMNWSTWVMSWLEGVLDFPVHYVRYEDLKKDTEKNLIGLLEFIGMPVDRVLVRKTVNACKFQKLQKQEQEKGFKEAPPGTLFFNSGSSGRWKKLMSKYDQQRIKDSCCKQMERFSYE